MSTITLVPTSVGEFAALPLAARVLASAKLAVYGHAVTRTIRGSRVLYQRWERSAHGVHCAAWAQDNLGGSPLPAAHLDAVYQR